MENNNFLEKLSEFIQAGNTWLKMMTIWNAILILGYGLVVLLILKLLGDLKVLIGV